jgi:hypothetical protein
MRNSSRSLPSRRRRGDVSKALCNFGQSSYDYWTADDDFCVVIARWRGLDDVMAHVHTFGVVAPEAAGIIQCVFPEGDLRTGVDGRS